MSTELSYAIEEAAELLQKVADGWNDELSVNYPFDEPLQDVINKLENWYTPVDHTVVSHDSLVNAVAETLTAAHSDTKVLIKDGNDHSYIADEVIDHVLPVLEAVKASYRVKTLSNAILLEIY